MEPEDSLLCSQKLTIRLYPEPGESSLHIDPYFPKVHFNIILLPVPWSSQQSLPFRPPNLPCKQLSPPPCMPHVLPTSSSLI